MGELVVQRKGVFKLTQSQILIFCTSLSDLYKSSEEIIVVTIIFIIFKNRPLLQVMQRYAGWLI